MIIFNERAALSDLTFVGNVGGTAKAPVHHYRFPAQETELRGGEDLRRAGGEKFGKIEDISLDQRFVDIKKRVDSAGIHPDAIFAHDIVPSVVLAESLLRIGEWVADHGIETDGEYAAARSLLLRQLPQMHGEPLTVAGESILAGAMRIAPHLAGGVVPIQGPPGTGKTHVGARMIATLVKAGKRVGVTANSHTVIRRLLDEVVRAGFEIGVQLKCIQKTEKGEATDCIVLSEDQSRSVCRFALELSGRGWDGMAVGQAGGSRFGGRAVRGRGGADVVGECVGGVAGRA